MQGVPSPGAPRAIVRPSCSPKCTDEQLLLLCDIFAVQLRL